MMKLSEKYGCPVEVGDYSVIADDVVIDCPEGFKVGRCSYIGKGAEIRCRSFEADSYFYAEKRVEVGRGGCMGPRSDVTIGKSVFLGADVVINPSEPVHIGSFTGIGAEVGIWTHGAWPNPLDGVPGVFKPVWIGDHVWLTGGSKVLPGVSIHEHAVVGMLSLVNKDVEPWTLVGGVPAKPIKRIQPLSPEQRLEALDQICMRYLELVTYKGIRFPVEIVVEFPLIRFSAGNVNALFDLEEMTLQSAPAYTQEAVLIEGFRDFLRRNGIRFLTGFPFQPLM